MEEKQKPLNLEQAANFIKAKEKTIASDIKQEVSKQAISMAPPEDLKRYLIYGVSLLDNISESLKNAWCAACDKPSVMYTTKDVATLLKKYLILRVNGYSIRQIAHHLKTTEITLGKVDGIAIRAVKEAIEKRQATGIPILGVGNN